MPGLVLCHFIGVYVGSGQSKLHCISLSSLTLHSPRGSISRKTPATIGRLYCDPTPVKQVSFLDTGESLQHKLWTVKGGFSETLTNQDCCLNVICFTLQEIASKSASYL